MKLTIVRGLPGSGKSTYAKQIGVFHVENDFFCMINGKYCFDLAKTKERANLAIEMAEICLKSGADCVVSSTFTQKWEIEPYIELAKKYKAEKQIITLKTQYKSIHNIPNEVMIRMKNRWEKYPLEKIIE